jgi:SAM-dependent methyltransferase
MTMGGDRSLRWTEISDDPNSPDVLTRRAAEVGRAHRGHVADRISLITSMCRGRRVLDLGCVDHFVERQAKASWLHRQIVEVASECTGADINPAGVRSLNEQGFRVVEHDVCLGPGPLMSMAPFDVIVAGELVEHLRDPLTLFETSASLLGPAGTLVITTPNPYAPHRFFAGLSGRQWENVDHLFYAFPSGVAELASRTGLELVDCRTTSPLPWKGTLRLSVMHVMQRLGPRRDESSAVAPTLLPVWFVIANRRRWSTLFSGETAIYVLRRAPAGERS